MARPMMMREHDLTPQMARLARDPVFVSVVETLAAVAPELGKPSALMARLFDLGPGLRVAVADSPPVAAPVAAAPVSAADSRRAGCQMVRIPEAAKLLAIHPNTVKMLLKTGQLPFVRVSKTAIAISLAAIETFLTGQTSFNKPVGEE